MRYSNYYQSELLDILGRGVFTMEVIDSVSSQYISRIDSGSFDSQLYYTISALFFGTQNLKNPYFAYKNDLIKKLFPDKNWNVHRLKDFKKIISNLIYKILWARFGKQIGMSTDELLQEAFSYCNKKGREEIIKIFADTLKMTAEATIPSATENIIQNFVEHINKPTKDIDFVTQIALAYYSCKGIEIGPLYINNKDLRALIDNSPFSSEIQFTFRFNHLSFKESWTLSDKLTVPIFDNFLSKYTTLKTFLENAIPMDGEMDHIFLFEFYELSSLGASSTKLRHKYKAPKWEIDPNNKGELAQAVCDALATLQYKSGDKILAIRFKPKKGYPTHDYLLVMSYNKIWGFGNDIEVFLKTGQSIKNRLGSINPHFLLDPEGPKANVLTPQQKTFLKEIINTFNGLSNSYTPDFVNCIDPITGAPITYEDYMRQIIVKFNKLAQKNPIYNLYSDDGKIYWWNVYDTDCKDDKIQFKL